MFDEIMKYYLDEFHKGGEPVLKTIINLSAPSKIVLSEYKKLPPIEKMPEHDKSELKKYVIEMFPGKTVEQLVDAAKIIYTIGTLA